MLIPGIGMQISLNGCLLATKTARKDTILRKSQQWTLLGCSFSGIAADDYDALVRLCKDMKEVDNKAARELASMDKTDDAYRMLPMRVQQLVLDVLIHMGRLDLPQVNQQPLLRMHSMGNEGGKHHIIDDSGNVKVES